MPPKVKITKEEIIRTAVDIVRTGGAQAINARTIAGLLGCSTQPVFSNFDNMEDLRKAVIQEASIIYRTFSQDVIRSELYPVYKANGMAYIRFAKEEPELFKLLFMCDRCGEPIPEDDELSTEMETIVHHNTGLENSEAKLFHLEMWAFVHGIATMFATGFLDLDWEIVSKMLTDAYLGLRKQYGTE